MPEVAEHAHLGRRRYDQVGLQQVPVVRITLFIKAWSYCKSLNDDDHSYEYVITMLQQLFGYPPEKGFMMAKEVDTTGRVILLTTTKEHAELKRDQIHAFGPDPGIPRCQGSMSAVIEPAPG